MNTRRAAVLATLAATSMSYLGCTDPNAAQQAAAEQQLANALQLIHQAEQSWVPQGEEAFDEIEQKAVPLQIQQYRQKVLGDAARELEQAVKSSDPRARMTASRLLADIYVSEARNLSRQAMADWAELEGSSATMLSMLNAVNKANARAQHYNFDESDLLLKLRDDQQRNRTERNGLEDQIKKLETRIAGLEVQIQELAEARDQATRKAESLNTKAFTAAGSQQYDLQIQGIAAQRDADKAAAKSEELGVHLTVFQSELTVLRKQLDLNLKADRSLEESIQVANQRQQLTAKTRQQALADADVAAKAFRERYNQIGQRQNRAVAEQFRRADSRCRDSVKQLQDAVALVDGREKRSVEADLLAKQVSRVHLLIQYVMTTGSYGEMLKIVAEQARQALPDTASHYIDNADQVEKRQTVLVGDTEALIREASDLAARLYESTAEGEDLRTFVRQQINLLEGYSLQLAQARIGAQPALTADDLD